MRATFEPPNPGTASLGRAIQPAFPSVSQRLRRTPTAQIPLVHAGGRNRLDRGTATPTAFTEPNPMTCYRVSHGNESFAIVNSLGMAQAITRCQPPGYYRVDEIQVDPPNLERQSPSRRQGIRPPGGHRWRKPGARSGQRISLRLQGAQRPRGRLRLRNLTLQASGRKASQPRT